MISTNLVIKSSFKSYYSMVIVKRISEKLNFGFEKVSSIVTNCSIYLRYYTSFYNLKQHFRISESVSKKKLWKTFISSNFFTSILNISKIIYLIRSINLFLYFNNKKLRLIIDY